MLHVTTTDVPVAITGHAEQYKGPDNKPCVPPTIGVAQTTFIVPDTRYTSSYVLPDGYILRMPGTHLCHQSGLYP